jgi:hypothetical protein
MSILDHLLQLFGLRVENSRPPPRGVRQASSMATIGAIFDADAARQKSDSFYFNDRAGPPNFYIGPGGVKLPYFRVPDHLK